MSLGVYDQNVQNNGRRDFTNIQRQKTRAEDRENASEIGAVDQDVYPDRARRERRPNTRLYLDAVNAERLVRLQKSRSGPQGRLTDLNNKISDLLYDVGNMSVVKEMSEIFERQWGRFSFST